MKTVLIDLTALNTSRRLRGVGRHVRSLAAGLSSLSASETRGLRLVDTHLDALAEYEITEDFGDFEGHPEAREPSRIDDGTTRWLRRVSLSKVAEKIGADLVHAPDPVATPWSLGRVTFPRIATCHDLAAMRSMGPGFLRKRGFASIHQRLERRRYSSADHVIAISTYTADDLKALFGFSPSRVSVVYNGIDLDRWSSQGAAHDAQVLRKYSLRDRAFSLYVGQAAWRKNRSGMLRALRHARETRPQLGMKLVWAGRIDAHEIAAIDREARDLGIRHAVHLLNYVSDEELASLYRTASAHLIVSRHEGFGLTVVEAMACGCPVITTRRTALAEVAGDAAVHVEPEEYEDIGEAIVRVTDDSALRLDLIRRGLERANGFSHSRQARETVAVYRHVLGI